MIVIDHQYKTVIALDEDGLYIRQMIDGDEDQLILITHSNLALFLSSINSILADYKAG